MTDKNYTSFNLFFPLHSKLNTVFGWLIGTHDKLSSHRYLDLSQVQQLLAVLTDRDEGPAGVGCQGVGIGKGSRCGNLKQILT